MVRVLRPTIRDAPKRLRHGAKNVLQKLQQKKSKKKLLQCYVLLSLLPARHPAKANLFLIMIGLYHRIRNLSTWRLTIGSPRIPKKEYRIASFSKEECRNLFRFKKKHLTRLFKRLGIYTLPEYISLTYRHKCHREHMFLMLLCRYSCGGTYYDLYRMGWGFEAYCCDAFNMAAKILFSTWGQRVKNCIEKTMPRFYAYNVAIKKRLRRNGLVGAYPPDAENLAMCYDGTRRDVGEPVDPFVENALYSAYTGTHCLGYLTISTPDGLIIFVDGPFEGHHNDITMANLSGINAKIRDPQIGNVNQFGGYGDRIFIDDSHVKNAPRGQNLPPLQVQQARPLRPIRSQIAELPFGKICTLWHFCNWDPAQKVLLCPVAMHYINIIMFTNSHTGFYGGQTSDYFEMEPPVFEKLPFFL